MQGKNELCRLAWSLLNEDVKSFITDEVNAEKNTALLRSSQHQQGGAAAATAASKGSAVVTQHEVTIAEMLVLHSLFRETSTARLISKISNNPYDGNMKSVVVMEVARVKKLIYRVSPFTIESCTAYLTFPLITDKRRPDLIKQHQESSSTSASSTMTKRSVVAAAGGDDDDDEEGDDRSDASSDDEQQQDDVELSRNCQNAAEEDDERSQQDEGEDGKMKFEEDGDDDENARRPDDEVDETSNMSSFSSVGEKGTPGSSFCLNVIP
jgi:hypothetical protein